MNERTKIATITSIFGIGLNIVLFLLKIFIGFVSNSISIISDAFNNLTDAISVIISFVGTCLSNKAPDEKHPYGYGRVEYICAFIIAFLVLQVGLFTFINSVQKIIHKENLSSNIYTIIILVVSIFLKILMGCVYKRVSKKINSDVFMAASQDSFSDVLITFATLISTIIFIYFNVNVDAYLGIIVSIIIFINGVKIVRDTLKPIIGESVDRKLYDKIIAFVSSYEGIYGVHDLIVHNYGPNSFMASIHAEVDSKEDLITIHDIIDKIESDIKEQMGVFLVIHMDPSYKTDDISIKYKGYLTDVFNEILKEYRNLNKIKIEKADDISFHDFRVVKGENEKIVMCFDVIIPWNFDDKLKDILKEEIEKKLKQRDSNIIIEPVFESAYV